MGEINNRLETLRILLKEPVNLEERFYGRTVLMELIWEMDYQVMHSGFNKSILRLMCQYYIDAARMLLEKLVRRLMRKVIEQAKQH